MYGVSQKNKLLTITKNYHCNRCKRIGRLYNSLKRNNSRSRVSWYISERKRIKKQQKKADELEEQNKRYRRYDLLNEYCFTSLKTDIIEYYDLSSEIDSYLIGVRFHDPISNRLIDEHPSLYDEGIKHLKKDIPDIIDRLSSLEECIRLYDEQLKKFENHEIYYLVKDYFKYDFNIVTNFKEIDNKVNTICVSYDLLSILKQKWCKGIPFNSRYDDNKLLLNNTIVAIVNDDRKDRLDELLGDIRNYDKVICGYLNLVEYFNKIKGQQQTLSDEIDEKIITKIMTKTYPTTCEECK